VNPRRIVEHRTCRRHGLCLAVAPEAFTVGPDGRVQVTGRTDPAALAKAQQAARLCPTQAIKVREP
jgi:ferredoxin